jgi:hypothetical protein
MNTDPGDRVLITDTASLVRGSWSLNTISYWKKPELLREMVDFRPKSVKVQNDRGTSYRTPRQGSCQKLLGSGRRGSVANVKSPVSKWWDTLSIKNDNCNGLKHHRLKFVSS